MPAVDAQQRVQNPIDGFVLSRLEQSRLSMSPEADRATLIRRVAIDLLGLPPTYEEVQEFENDTRPDAYERLVDRLLASPRYGERWGRHWLDVARFAESNGFERDRIRTEFWRYRDWVIDAFNRDLPFDDFVREQLAADALHPDQPEALIATGFLVSGPKNDVDTISELERLTTRQDELDEFVVATGTTFLGLTIGCARCHDHKFDPITARDYYSLTAVFSGLDRDNNVVASREAQSQHGQLVARARDEINSLKDEMRHLIDPVREQIATRMENEGEAPGTKSLLAAVRVDRNEDAFEPVDARFIRLFVNRTNDGSNPCVDELEVYGTEPKRNLALAAGGAKATASSLLPGYPIHQVEHLNDGKVGNSWSWISNEAGAGWAQVELPAVAQVSRVIWGRDRETKFADRLAVGYRIEASLDGKSWQIVSSSERRRPYRPDLPTADKIPLDQILAVLEPEQRISYSQLAADLTRAEAALQSIPGLPVSYSAKDTAPREAWVLKRGNVRERGDNVSPAAPSAVHGLPGALQSETGDSGPERRRRLAEWIADPRNPLTARVLVNRIWHYHFGQGIVNTPSDFGFNGDRPSHPELLDWLASEFVEPTREGGATNSADSGPRSGAWSMKRLHRQIVLSATYRQSSRHRPDAAAIDATNRLLWRMNPRRLESESVRDAILHVSGALNLTMGGPSYRLFEYRDGILPDYLLLANPGPETFRRAVYMFNIRTFHEPLMTVFDCPDPSVQTPRREQSTTALQALSLMNNNFVFGQSQRFAERATQLAGANASSSDLAKAAIRLAFARDPRPEELTEAAAFIDRADLFSLCRVLLNANEFLYVR